MQQASGDWVAEGRRHTAAAVAAEDNLAVEADSPGHLEAGIPGVVEAGPAAGTGQEGAVVPINDTRS